VRWMCAFKLKDRKSSHELLGQLGVEDVVGFMKSVRLWFGNVERKLRDDLAKMCRDLAEEGHRSKHRRKKRGINV
jgi:hypothetical protein